MKVCYIQTFLSIEDSMLTLIAEYIAEVFLL